MVVVNKSITRANAEQAVEDLKNKLAEAEETLRKEKARDERPLMINMTAEEARQFEIYGEIKRKDIPLMYMDFRYPHRKNHGNGLWQFSGIMLGNERHHILPHMADIMEKIYDPTIRAGRGDGFNHTHFHTQLARHGMKNIRNISLTSDQDICEILINTPL